MGWLFSFVLFIVGCVTHNDTLLLASGLFAIAGAISFASIDIRQGFEKLSGGGSGSGSSTRE